MNKSKLKAYRAIKSVGRMPAIPAKTLKGFTPKKKTRTKTKKKFGKAKRGGYRS